MLLSQPPLALQELVTYRRRLSPENIPVRKPLEPGTLPWSKVSILIWMYKVGIEPCWNRVTWAVGIHSSIILVIDATGNLPLAVPTQGTEMTGHI
jgi:hypothetical protein